MKEKLSLLKSEIRDDLARIDRLYQRFEHAWKEYRTKKEYSLLVESAFTVNQIYTGCERVFRNVAATFENCVDSDLWHRSLLERMRLDIEDIRPRLLSEESYQNLAELLAFRHYFRHAYDSDINYDKFTIVASCVAGLRGSLYQDLHEFIEFINELNKGP